MLKKVLTVLKVCAGGGAESAEGIAEGAEGGAERAGADGAGAE